MADSTNTETGEKQGAPWTEETFDAKRAWDLVENLRGEVAALKQTLADEKQKTAELATVTAERDTLKATVEAQAGDLVKVSKEKVLRDRGLPVNLISALSGDDENSWVEIADMMKSLKGTDSGGKADGSDSEPSKPPVKPDPFQQATDNGAGLTEDAKRLALAKQVFN